MLNTEKIEDPALEAIRKLREETRNWVKHTMDAIAMGPDEVRILILAGQAFDESQAARQVLEVQGLTYMDRWDCPRPRPEVAIERDGRAAYARLVGMLNLVPPLDNPAGLYPPRNYPGGGR